MFPIQPTQHDLCFRMLGFPVRVNPFFWVVIALIGAGGCIGNMQLWLIGIVIWVAAAFISVLVHELGHALVFRHVFSVQSDIFLYGLGGATVPRWNHSKKNNFGGMVKEVFLSFAGPLAGFILAAVVIFFFYMFDDGRHGLLTSLLSIFLSQDYVFYLTGVNSINPKFFAVLFLWQLAFISVFWGVFNLLPIYPMDGGHITREVFNYISPRRGVGNSLILSLFTAVIMLLLAVKIGMFFVAMLFGFFAYQNYQELRYRVF
ncbi:MAG: site-2 protease family protein [Planctomycetaceae bacterium]|nr:site-2 protease family protein [Planctomycetaceae bacterium]